MLIARKCWKLDNKKNFSTHKFAIIFSYGCNTLILHGATWTPFAIFKQSNLEKWWNWHNFMSRTVKTEILQNWIQVLAVKRQHKCYSPANEWTGLTGHRFQSTELWSICSQNATINKPSSFICQTTNKTAFKCHAIFCFMPVQWGLLQLFNYSSFPSHKNTTSKHILEWRSFA